MYEEIRTKLRENPTAPGVYLFKDARSEVLYIGKAKSLRGRVRTYFNKSGGHAAGHRPPARPCARRGRDRDLDGSRGAPPRAEPRQAAPAAFNVRLRDDKSFPYIAVTVEDEYPRVMFTRERHRRGTIYFGPYANAKKVRETLDVLNRVFQFRPCEGQAGPAFGHSLPRLPHRAVQGAVRGSDRSGRVPEDHRRRDRVPLG